LLQRFRALRIPRAAVAFACLHSVPPTASAASGAARLAAQLQQIATTLGIPLADYVVFHNGRCRSLRRGARLP
jgi:hypothetical protein